MEVTDVDDGDLFVPPWTAGQTVQDLASRVLRTWDVEQEGQRRREIDRTNPGDRRITVGDARTRSDERARLVAVEADEAYKIALARWQRAVAGEAERDLKRTRDLRDTAPPGTVLMPSPFGPVWTDPEVHATLEDRVEAERKLQRARTAVTAAEAAEAAARYNH